MLEIHPRLLLYQGVIFIVFAFLMWKFVYKNLVKMVEDRRRKIENTILEAEKKRGEADALRKGYESKIDELNAQAGEVLRRAEAEGWRKHEEIVASGRQDARQMAAQNRLQCAADVEAAMLAAKAELLDIAAVLSKKALGRALTPDVEARLIEELSAEIQETGTPPVFGAKTGSEETGTPPVFGAKTGSVPISPN
jgi:F-type H+-transporting ATPase subunit b